MSDATKPREGYIPKFSLVPIDSPLANAIDREAVYHVIEYSAYRNASDEWTKFEEMYWFQKESLDIERDRNAQLRSQNEKFKAALKNAKFVLEGSVAIEDQTDEMLDKRGDALCDFLEVLDEALAPNQDKEKPE